MLDLPNERSSHVRPTPRGGGLSIVLVVLAGTALAWWLGVLEGSVAGAVLGGGAAVAAIGWVDDHVGVSRRHRAIVHLIAATLAVALLGGMESVRYGTGALDLGPAGSILAVLLLAWLINLYNFMDGIDGLAGGEAVIVGLAGGALALAAGAHGVATLSLLTAGAAAGFLLWNWPPARIFMGDVGSSFLGYIFGVIAIGSERAGAAPLLVWVLLLGVFIFDATVTLARRIVRGETWYRAHRSHAYQRAVQSGWSHRRVTVGILFVNVALALLAAIGLFRPTMLLAVCGIAVLLLAALYLFIERRLPPPPVREIETAEARS